MLEEEYNNEEEKEEFEELELLNGKIIYQKRLWMILINILIL